MYQVRFGIPYYWLYIMITDVSCRDLNCCFCKICAETPEQSITAITKPTALRTHIKDLRKITIGSVCLVPLAVQARVMSVHVTDK